MPLENFFEFILFFIYFLLSRRGRVILPLPSVVWRLYIFPVSCFFHRVYIGIENFFADTGQLLTSCEALICTWCWWGLLQIEDVDSPDFSDFLLQRWMLVLFWCLLGRVQYIANYHRTMLPCWHHIRFSTYVIF